MASWFPRGQQEFRAARQKFAEDAGKIQAQGLTGIAFVTNQEVRLAQRDELHEVAKPLSAEIFHLERICATLDSPDGYGVRLEFLDMPMTLEEQVSFVSRKDAMIQALSSTVNALAAAIAKKSGEGWVDARIKSATTFRDDSWLTSTSVLGKKMQCVACGLPFYAQRGALAISAGLYSTEYVRCPECDRMQPVPLF